MTDVNTIDGWRSEAKASLQRLCARYAREALSNKQLCTKEHVSKVLEAVSFFTPEPLQTWNRGMMPLVLSALSSEARKVTLLHKQQVAVLYQGAAAGLEFVK